VDARARWCVWSARASLSEFRYTVTRRDADDVAASSVARGGDGGDAKRARRRFGGERALRRASWDDGDDDEVDAVERVRWR